MSFLTLLAYAITLIICLPLAVLAAECLLAMLPARKQASGEREPCAVLIPAHDEEQGIGATLENVRSQLREGDRIVVVADNCRDRTAAIASEGGAETVIRDDSTRRGKGFALEAGIRYLIESSESGDAEPAIVVIQDADCEFRPGSLDCLVRASVAQDRVVQSLYLMHAPESSGPPARLSAFAFLVKNWVRPRGMNRLGGSVPLTGSGMAFPWHTIKSLELGTSEIVEDLELGLKLVVQGRGPRFCEVARVDSHFPATATAARQQRTRWEHGYLGQMRAKAPPLFRAAFRGNVDALVSGLDLMVPPLSLLAMLTMVAGFMIGGIYRISGDPIPSVIYLISVGAAAVGLASAWSRFGRQTLTLRDIFWIPAYAGGKLSMYLAALVRAETKWNRTDRQGEHERRTEV